MSPFRSRAGWMVGLTVALLAGPSFAVVGMGMVAAESGASALVATIEAIQREMVSESSTAANQERLFQKLKQAREQLVPIKEHNQAMLRGVKARVAELEQMYGGADPAGWKAADRAEHQRNREALQQLEGVQSQLNGGWENLKWLQGRNNVPGFNPLQNQTFKDKLKEMGTQVADVAEAYRKFGDAYNVETATPDPGSSITVVKATHVTVRNDSQDMLFKVAMSTGGAPLTIKPGESQPFRLGDHGSIFIRALTWDKTRQQILSIAERFADGEMKTAKLHEKVLPYFIHYGTDRLASFIRSEKEEYRWTMGNNITRAAGRKSPWAPSNYETPEPEVTSSNPTKADDIPAVTNDQVSWLIPAVEDSTVQFGFQVMGTVEWLTQRRMASGQQTNNSEPLVSSGTLTVIVAP